MNDIEGYLGIDRKWAQGWGQGLAQRSCRRLLKLSKLKEIASLGDVAIKSKSIDAGR